MSNHQQSSKAGESTRVVLHRGAKFDYVESVWQGPKGRELRRQFVQHPGSVVVLPILERPGEPDKIVLIRNFRHAVGQELWELPAGTRDRVEPIERCAERELVEETGYRAGRLDRLGSFYTGPGLTDELMHAFVARGLELVGQDLEEDEGISVHPLEVARVLRMAERAELVDSKSLAAIFLALRKGILVA